MTPQQGTVPANSSLDDINKVITQTENIVGPLVTIDNDGTQTVLTFDSDQPAPGENAVIAADVGGQPIVPASNTQVCRGTIFIAGTLTACTASRPA
jgi:hypothetical protein